MVQPGTQVSRPSHCSQVSAELWALCQSNTLTDLSLVCCDGKTASHAAMLWTFLTQHGIGLAEVDTIIIPDINLREMEHHLEIIYLTGNLNILYQCLNGSVISEDLKQNCPEDPSDNEDKNRDPVFSGEDKMRRRIVKDLAVTEKSELYCEECGKRFSRKDHLKRHSLTHTGEKPHICDICGSRYSRGDALHLHKVTCQLRHESASELLTITGKSEGKTLEKVSHLLFDKVVDCIWGCKLCYSIFETEIELENHRASLHSSSSEKYGSHWVTSLSKFKCPNCEKLLKTKHLIWFIYHMEKCKRGHSSPETQLFLCHICSKSFHSKPSLKMHVNYVHTEERPHVCGVCNKSYKIRSELNQHILTHSENFNYSCETCGKQFRGKANLRMHMKTHLSEEEKKNVCCICGHRFARLQHLRNHQTTHSNVGTFSCDICGSKSKTMDALRQHRKSHRTLAPLNTTNMDVDQT